MDTQLLKKLRSETQAPINDCKSAIEEAGGDYNKALQAIRSKGLDKAAKKAGRETGVGFIETYVHGGGRVGVMLELRCETDFVARNEMFRALAHDVAMQIAAMSPETPEALLEQAFIKDASLTIKQLVQSVVGKIGENIQVSRFTRYEI